MAADIIYALCALTSFLCTWLLLQAYARSRYKLLLWGGLCFAGLSLNNILLVLDKIFISWYDFSTWRIVTGLISFSILLYGLIWDKE
jgi:hypothetical protein